MFVATPADSSKWYVVCMNAFEIMITMCDDEYTMLAIEMEVCLMHISAHTSTHTHTFVVRVPPSS